MKRIARNAEIHEYGISISKKRLNEEHCTHWHTFYEIEYILSGEGDYVIDGICYPIRPGMLFFMTPRNFHSVNARNCTVYNAMFSEELCEHSYLSRMIGAGNVFETSDLSFYEALFSELTPLPEDKTMIGHLFNAILGKVSGTIPPSRFSDPVTRGMLFLLNHFRENPSLTQIAEQIGYTPTYFSKLFRESTGETFQEHRDHLRFDYAKKLVKHSDLPISRICFESGFSDYPNFLRRFRLRFGASPGELRNESLPKPETPSDPESTSGTDLSSPPGCREKNETETD